MKLLIAGAFGYGNLGDDAVRDVELALLRLRGVETKWAAPADFRIDGVDGVLVGGGGILYDGDYANIDNYCKYIELAHAKGIPAAFVNVGTSGFNTARGKDRMIKCLKLTKAVSVRDPEDAVILETMGAKNVFIAEDSAWALSWRKTKPVNGEFGFAWRTFSLRSYDGVKYTRQALKANPNGRFYVTSAEDIPGLRMHKCQFVVARSLVEIAEKYTCSILACTRFHGIISAIASGIEPIVCYRSSCSGSKLTRMMKRLDLRRVDLDLPEWPDQLVSLFASGPISRDWLAIAESMRRKAEEGIHFAFDALTK